MASRVQGLQRRLSIKSNTKIMNLETENQKETNLLNSPDRFESKNMNEIITKSVTSKDPQYGRNLIYFNYSEMQYKVIEQDEHHLEILNLESSIIHNTDKIYNSQLDYHKRKINLKKKVKKEDSEFNEVKWDSIKSMRNQLTFASRTSQTLNPQILNKEIGTLKLLRNNHSGIMHKWDVFDKYMSKYVFEEEERKREDMILKFGKVNNTRDKPKIKENTESLQKPSLLKTLKLVERQIMQILNSESYYFYREWNKIEDSTNSNNNNNDQKQLMMLLPFPQNASIRNKSVTAICWNPKHEDLFAVGYGSYNFPKKKDEKDLTEINNNTNNNTVNNNEERSDDILESGYIFVFSIKNNYYPEVKYTTETGVLSLDFHSKQFNYLVAGMYDGTVSVFDIIQKIKAPIITCDIRNQRHFDPVWQVKWYNYSENDEYIFYSISSDGKVNKWSFFKNKTNLELEEMVTLKYSQVENHNNNLDEENNVNNSSNNGNGNNQEFIFGNAGGMCFDFNNHKGYEHLFVLGTEEGHLHLCSVKHRGHYIQTYEGHTMGTYTVTWNPFHAKIFASCSADWTIKIWHYKHFNPLIIFDMQNAVGDISWSPWCSTIFAAVTVSGDMKFFDLNRNRKQAIYEKKYQDIAINHIAFNKFEFVFLTGNEKGKVRLWRMSDNLRTTLDKKDEEINKDNAKQNSQQKLNLPETKINAPKHLLGTTTKAKKVIEIKKDNKVKGEGSEGFILEKERISKFLELLDIIDD